MGEGKERRLEAVDSAFGVRLSKHHAMTIDGSNSELPHAPRFVAQGFDQLDTTRVEIVVKCVDTLYLHVGEV